LPEEQEHSRLDPQLLAQHQQPRTALIIANYDYEGDDYDLVGPRQDAEDMYEKLKSLGFDVPPPVVNATKQEIDSALRDFGVRIQEGGINIFYYSGHGVQIDGVNYLMPVDLAATSSQVYVQYNAVRLDYVVSEMFYKAPDFNFLIIDACRNNPYYSRWGRPKGPGNQGLASTRPPRGTMIAYAAEENEVAIDGDGGNNSLFTASLLNYLQRSGLTIYQLLYEVQQEVEARTNGEQVPSWEGYPRYYDIALNPSTLTAPPPTTASPPVLPPAQPTPAPQTPSPAPTTAPILISAATGVNYQPLRDALAAGDFRLADQATRNLMQQAAGRESEGWFREEDLRNFSCEDLKIIDQLWLDYSDGKFGFSVQQEIYQSLGGTSEFNNDTWKRFGDQVGWRVNDNWLRYDDLTFSNGGVAGHLPLVLSSPNGGAHWISGVTGWSFLLGSACRF